MPCWIDEDGDVLRVLRDQTIIIRNTTGSPLTKGQFVNFNGSTGTVPTVNLADADSATGHAEGVILEDIANNGYGHMLFSGIISGLDTSALTEGALIYLSQTAGGFTTTAPTPPAFVQPLGVVVRSHVNQGSLEIAIRSYSPFAGSAIIPVGYGSTGIASYSQGDILYASGTTTLSKLAKNVTATRYLSNTGTSNNPA